MLKKLIAGLLLFALSASAVGQSAKATKVSSPEDRQRALTIIGKLEQSPLDPVLKEDRDWVFQWVKEVSDINVVMCTSIIRPLLDQPNSPERNALTLQTMLAGAAFSIRNLDRPKASILMFMASTEGAIRAYKNMVRQDPTKKNDFMESLAKLQREGTLEAYVRQGVAECRKHPATELNP